METKNPKKLQYSSSGSKKETILKTRTVLFVEQTRECRLAKDLREVLAR